MTPFRKAEFGQHPLNRLLRELQLRVAREQRGEARHIFAEFLKDRYRRSFDIGLGRRVR